MFTDSNAWVGRELAGGRYRIDSLLGEGGMGFVYRATDRNLECTVVVKVPRRALLDDPDFAPRFAREVRSLVNLAHPHIVKLSDVGTHDGLPFAVMQYLSGGSLEDRRPSGPEGAPLPLPPATLAGWLPDIARALDFVHDRGYVHRDVKPANILFDPEGHAYLSDFGIAKALVADKGAVATKGMTRRGIVLGTPEYMAPEVIMGEPFDGRADQYALASTVYELLAGRRPFDGPTEAAILVMQTTQEPPDLRSLCPTVPAALAANVHRALSKPPEHRFPDCETFARSLLKAIVQAGPNTPAPRPVQRTPVNVPRPATPPPAPRSGQTRKQVANPTPAPPVKTPPQAEIPTRWHWLRDGKVQGPFTFAELVSTGKLQPTSQVREDAPDSVWVAARSIAGLIAVQKEASAPRTSRRKPRLVWAAVGLAALAVVGAVAMRGNGRERRPPVPVEPKEEQREAAQPIVVAPAPPQLAAVELQKIEDWEIKEGDPVRLQALVQGPDVAGRKFQFSLGAGHPKEAAIDPDSGRFEWKTTDNDGPKTYPIEVRVTEPGRMTFKLQRFQIKVRSRAAEREAEAKEAAIAIAKAKEAAMSGTRAGEERDDNELKIKFCWCPPGSFRMGSPVNEPNRSADEGPVQVTLSRSFWLGKFEVTQSQWRTVMGTTRKAAGYGEGPDHPMYFVSHTDAEEFCQQFTESERGAGRLPSGWEYRLPTEAQWEYACRAGTTSATAFGDQLSSVDANFDGNHPYNGAAKGPNLKKTMTVGHYRPNKWGLYDMHGNVWEWCRDEYEKQLPGGPDPLQAPAGGASGRVIRGGSWSSSGRDLPVGDPRQDRTRGPEHRPGVPGRPSFVRVGSREQAEPGAEVGGVERSGGGATTPRPERKAERVRWSVFAAAA